ncbi:cytochrome P450 [Moorena producens]|uniref:cytochrome P450 n=1 Tax=Moorena producens TaxID=1155739 RepID=UPI003C76441D
MQSINELKTPAFFQKIQWIFDPVGYLSSFAQLDPDLVMVKGKAIGVGDCPILVYHPQAIQQILTNDRNKLTAPGEFNQIFEPAFGKHSIVMLSGARHRRERKLLMPSFHRDRMHIYGALIGCITDKVISQIPLNQPFKSFDVTEKITIQVIIQIIFGLHEGERCEQIIQLTCALLNFMSNPLTASLLFVPFLQKNFGVWSPWGYFLHLQKQLDDLLYAEISERRQNPEPKRTDILSLLMSVRDETGQEMTNQELRDELITFLLVGHDTTAVAMAWGLYWIHRHPEVQEKLIQELDSLGDTPDPLSIFRLPYLTAVCNETLRIHHVAIFSFPRVVQEPIELLGHQLNTGTILMCCLYLTHQREDIYPEPKMFKPERFLERQFSPYEFIPFGGGSRRCLGEALAQFELKLALAKILSSYELELAESKPVKPQRRGTLLAPKGGVKMRLKGKRISQNKKN